MGLKAGTLIVLLAMVTGCGQRGAAGAGGENAPEWSLVEEARIGSADDAEQTLTHVSDVAIAGDGRLYVAQPMDAAVRVFRGDGSAADAIGGDGEGPGEFRRLNRIVVSGDRLMAGDDGLHRLSFFTLDGELLETVPWTTEMHRSNDADVAILLPTTPHVLLSDSTGLAVSNYAVRMMGAPSAGRFASERRIPVLRVTRGAAVTDTIAWSVSHNLGARMAHGGELFSLGAPFPVSSRSVLMSDGSGVVVVDTAVTGTDAPSFSVTRIDANGDTAFTRALTYMPMPVPEAEVQRAVARIHERLSRRPGAPDAAAIEAGLREHRLIPEHLPPVTGLAGGQDGTIWIRRESVGDTVAWNVLGSDGELRGIVRLPAGQTVIEADGDVVVVTELDELDVPYLVKYRVQR